MLHDGRNGFPGGFDHVQDRMVFAGADVQDSRTGSLPPQRQFHRPGDIGHVGQVAALAAVSIDYQRLACFDPATERFQGKVGALTGSPDREEPQGEEAQAVLAGVVAAPLLAVELGQRVGAARIRNRRFLGRQRRVRAINAGRRCEDEVGDAHVAAVIQQADRAEDVGELVIDLAVHGWPDTSARCQVDHRVEGFVGKQTAADVALVETHPLGQWVGRRQVVEGDDPVTRRVEVPHDVAANEAGRTGDQNGERAVFHATRRESTGSRL